MIDSMNPIQDKIYQHLSSHPYTIYFSNELMDALHQPYSLLQQTLLKMAENNIVDYEDVSTENKNDFMVKFILPKI